MNYEDFKDLPRGTTSDKVLGDKIFSIAKNSKYNGYQRGLASIVYTFFDKKSAAARANRSAGTSPHTGTVINSKYQQLVGE